MRKRFTLSSKARAVLRPHTSCSLLLAIFSLVLMTPQVCPAAEVTLAWDPNAEPDVAGYYVYCASQDTAFSIDVGSRLEVLITGLVPGMTYYFAVTAYRRSGDESYFSEQTIYTVPGASVSRSGSSGGGGCFIATAAYGSTLSPEVEILRAFRDRVLLTCGPGQSFVEWYYRVSPPIAAFIADHESLKMAVRLGLTPLVCVVKHPSSILLMVSVPLFLLVISKRARGSDRRASGSRVSSGK